MKSIKHLFSLFLSTIILFSSLLNVQAVNKLESSFLVGQVIDVIDSEVVMIKVLSNEYKDQIWKSKLIGVDTNASEKAFNYVYSSLNNKTVIFNEEKSTNNHGNWHQVYIKLDYFGDTINEILLKKGLAELDESYNQYSNYNLLKEKLKYAKENKLEIWNENEYNPLQPKININTAQGDYIENLLADTDTDLRSKIMNYRKDNIFNTKDELKFVSSIIDNEWLDVNRPKLVVCTNINTAEKYELQSLFSKFYQKKKKSELADNILAYRLKNGYFNDVEDIMKVNGIDKSMYNDFKDFISIDYKDKVMVDPKLTVNINTVGTSQLDNIDLISKSEAYKLYSHRDKNKYSYKTLGELSFIISPNSSYKIFQYELRNKIHINTATEDEIKALFDDYKISDKDLNIIVENIIENRPYNYVNDLFKIIPHYYYKIYNYIYVNEPVSDYQLTSLDKLSDSFHLQTNINTANDYELRSLFGQFDIRNSERQKIIDDIKENRPYETKYELYKIIPEKYFSTISNFIYTKEPLINVKYNLNLIDKQILINKFRLTDKQADEFIEKREEKYYRSYTLLPFNFSKYNDIITLYTNINNASVDELMLLSEDISESFAKEIAKYRDEHIFVSKKELYDFFKDNNRLNIYRQIKDVIVFK